MEIFEGFKSSWRVIKRPDFLPIIVVLGIGLLAGKGLIGEGYFNMHDDLQMMRQLQMEKCFLDGQIPCRWVPDMGYGFGYPLFNYYPPLPYLVGEMFRLVGYSFATTVKILFILSFVVSGFGMYLLAREFFGRLGGVLAAVFYIWAPYHAVDVYVRGAMNEAWALMWFPLILYSAYKLIVTERKFINWGLWLALAWFALFTSHNLMVIIFTPLFALWCLVWVVWFKAWKKLPDLGLSGIFAFGLAAFFTLPVLIEKGAVATDTLVVGYYEYTAHFADIRQLLVSRFWGYGPSVWMTGGDKMSFQVGWVHWASSIAVMALVAGRFLKKRKIDEVMLVAGLFVALGWFAAFMAHSRSTPLWQLVEELKFVQFPWRFLTLVILGFSLAAGAVVKLVPKALAGVVAAFSCLAVVVYSWSYFVPENGKLGPITDEEKFSGVAWEMQQTAGIYDYLPKTAKTAPKEPRKKVVEIVDGEGEVNIESYGTDWMRAKVEMVIPGTVRINIIDFPKWRVEINGEQVRHYIPDGEEWGRMYVDIDEGEWEISAKLYDTWPRKAGNALSVVSWGVVGGFLLFRVKRGEA